MRIYRFAKVINDVSFFEFKRGLTYKAKYHAKSVIEADRFYPSSKSCSVCGSIKSELKLGDRVYRCEVCKSVIDRDLNAAINLANYAQKRIGQVLPEFTPEDLTALLYD